MPRLKTDIIWPTEEEDREITRQAREDGTLFTDEELAEFKPFEESDLPESFKQAIRRRSKSNATS